MDRNLDQQPNCVKYAHGPAYMAFLKNLFNFFVKIALDFLFFKLILLSL